MKVLIVSPCGLPIPAVKGGAVLTLLESLIIHNEKNKKMDLTVVGSYDKEAEQKSVHYKMTKFLYLREPVLCGKADDLYEEICKRLLKIHHKIPHRYAWKLYVIQKIKHILREGQFERVVFENAGYLLHVLRDRKLILKYKGRLYYHIHNDIPDNIYIDGVAQCRLLLISEYLKKKVIKVCGEGISDNIEILHNGIDYDSFSQEFTEKNKIKGRLEISQEKKIVIFAGRIDPTKGIEQLCRAFSRLKRSDTVLLILGSHNFGSNQTSPFEEKMKKIFRSMGSSIRFTGYVPHNEIWKYYNIADIAVLPSMWEEPAGLTIIESMAAGLPVISTVSGGIPEFLLPGYGMLIQRDSEIETNLANAMDEMLDNLPYWSRQGKRASNYISEIVRDDIFYARFTDLISF